MSVSTSPLSEEYLDLLRVLGYGYLQNGYTERALILFKALHAINNDPYAMLNSLAYANLRCGKTEDALLLLDRRLEVSPIPAVTHLLRGQALSSLNRTNESNQAMELFIQTRQAAILKTKV